MNPAPLRRLSAGMLAAFALVALVLGYWIVVRGAGLVARNDNPRNVIAEQHIQRGQILDRNGNILAFSAIEADGTAIRTYPHPEAEPALGYYSLRYGVSGVEAGYDSLLRGDSLLTPASRFWNALLHRPQVGGEVRLTLDLAVQQPLAEAMRGHDGAAVVITATSGQVLALVSEPTYNPTTLDDQWEALSAEPSAPLLDRVTQGLYQPGTILQSVILAEALNYNLASPQSDWSGPLVTPADGTLLPCAGNESAVHSVFDGFLAACPWPVRRVALDLGATRLDSALSDFGLLDQPVFILPAAVVDADATPAQTDLYMTAIGQSDLTVTPLQMARVAAAFANGGRVPPIQLVNATREPGRPWAAVQPLGSPRGTVSRNAADQIASLMKEAVQSGDAQAAALPNQDTYGHVGLAVAGPEGTLNVWFIGFVYRPGSEPVAVAVLLEHSSDTELAAHIGRVALQAALLAAP